MAESCSSFSDDSTLLTSFLSEDRQNPIELSRDSPTCTRGLNFCSNRERAGY